MNYKVENVTFLPTSEHTHLIIRAQLIECNVNSECGGIMVWSQRGLLIWFISNYKGQVKLSLQTHRQKGVMQAFAQKMLIQSVCTPLEAPAK